MYLIRELLIVCSEKDVPTNQQKHYATSYEGEIINLPHWKNEWNHTCYK